MSHQYTVNVLGARYFSVYDTHTGLDVATSSRRAVAEKRADELNAETDQWGNSTVPDGGWDAYTRSMKV